MSDITEVTLTLRPATPLPAHTPELGEPHLSHAELAQRHGTHPRVRERLDKFARLHHLQIIELDLPHRIARLAGTSAHLAEAFGTGTASLPKPLAEDVEAVTGLHAEPDIRRKPLTRGPHEGRPRTLSQLAQAYQFPDHADLSGQTIGLIEFGGGFRPEDIAHFCHANGVPEPNITTVTIGKATNRPAHINDLHQILDAMDGRIKASSLDLNSDRMQAALLTSEVTMDIEIVAALAPGAQMVVYFAQPDQQLQALHHAVYDHHNHPSVLSISWGQAETELSPGSLHAANSVLQAAAHLGITVCASSGDEGAPNGSTDGILTVNFPASSPYSLACGGTTPHFETASDRVRVVEETAWNSTHLGMHGATGGGVSRIFPRPEWQQHAEVPANPAGHHGRGVPDVAGPADPRFGCDLVLAGRTFRSAGTSAVAPMWAALIARCNAILGRRCGYINAHLYRLAAEKNTALRPVVKGSNQGYEAGPGWNACTGHGTPVGVQLLRSIQDRFKPAAKPSR